MQSRYYAFGLDQADPFRDLCLNIVQYDNDGIVLVIADKNARIAHISPCGDQ